MSLYIVGSLYLLNIASLGMNTSIVPVYVSECSHAKHRGRAVAVQLSIVIVSDLLRLDTIRADSLLVWHSRGLLA